MGYIKYIQFWIKRNACTLDWSSITELDCGQSHNVVDLYILHWYILNLFYNADRDSKENGVYFSLIMRINCLI